ncbi:MAG: outer membrane protein assembly factor BamE domain-containing protein [Ignavibacteriaceae bacterium]
MKTKTFTISMLFLVLSALLLESCATSEQVTGRPIDPSIVQNIVDGKTTSEQIISWLGAPSLTTQLGDNTLYVYKYCVSEGSGFSLGYYGQTKSEEKCDELTVTFDNKGVVKAHNFVKRVNE